MKKIIFCTILSIVSLILIYTSFFYFTLWQLDIDKSYINYIQGKNNGILEIRYEKTRWQPIPTYNPAGAYYPIVVGKKTSTTTDNSILEWIIDNNNHIYIKENGDIKILEKGKKLQNLNIKNLICN